MNQQERYRTIPRVFFGRVLQNQKGTSKKRDHPMPDYTLDELIDWLKLQPNLTEIWQGFQNSNHDRNFAPSLDRLDDSLPYTLSNIRLVTWAENMAKSKVDHRNGKINKGHTRAKPVHQMDLEGKIIATFKSSWHAQEVTGYAAGNIRSCCLGSLKTAYGFKWMLA
mgnify:CR=1 FL=1